MNQEQSDAVNQQEKTQRKKILIADDEAHILHVVTMKLSNAGYEVITAMDGEEALELCRSKKPDLLITDCLLYTSPSPRDLSTSRMPSSA